ncbi:MAG TPA: maleylpyruvate isomerase family mycothiol-dependent enzyme [Actinomycetota bacterium]
MTISRDELLGIASAERARLGRMVQFADPESWEQPSAAEGWWNRDVMAHLAAADTAAAQLVAGEPAAEYEEFRAALDGRPFDVDALNAWCVARRSGLATREVLETWGRAADSLLAHAARLSDEDWREARYAWVAGDIAPRYLLQSRVVEWFLHGEDMRATNGVRDGWQINWQHWPVHLTIDLGVRMLPWALAQAGHDVRGRSIQIDVSGAGEGSWHWGLGPGEVPAPDAKPDTIVIGRAAQLALVAGRRLSADEALDAGNLVVGGDTDLGELALRTIRAYA